MTKKLSTLDKIIAASKMGYSATLKIEHNFAGYAPALHVIGMWTGAPLGLQEGENKAILLGHDDLIDYKITGYLYCGHLFGEPVIPEGQKFRVKGRGDIFDSIRQESYDRILLKISPNNKRYSYNLFAKSELEPVFE